MRSPRSSFGIQIFVLLALSLFFTTFTATGAGFTDPAAPAAPAQPENVACRPHDGKVDVVRVEWKDTNDGAADYRVYRKTVSDGSWGGAWQTLTDPDSKGRWQVVDNAAGGDVYQYRVTAFDGDGETSAGADQTCREPLFLDSTGGNFRMFYRLSDCPDYDGKSACTENVNVDGKNKHAAEVLVTSESYRTEIMSTLGFNDPATFNGSKPFPSDFFPCNNGCANGDGVQYPPDNFVGTNYDPATGNGEDYEIFVIGHEIFHKTQGAHGGSDDPFYKWLIEGQARSTEDKMCIFGSQAQCDIWDNQVDQYYLGQVNAYLGKPEEGLMEASYDAALFWTYVMEQFAGTNKTEPRYGFDFLLKFWQQNQENVDADPDGKSKDGITTLNETLANKTTSDRRFKDIFQDFAVANYAKDLLTNPAGAQDKKYNYIDEENCAGCAYDSVKLTVDDTLDPNETIFGTSTVESWGARYYEIGLHPSLPVININVKPLAGTPHSLYYHMLGIKGGSIVKHWSDTGTEFALSVFNIGLDYDKLALIVVGLEQPVNFRYGFNLTDGLYISTPTAQFPATAGEVAAPKKFILQVEVIGEDQQPVAGIDSSQFTITVGSAVINPPVNVGDSPIVASSYNGGKYWLVLRAPTSPGCTTCDLKVEYGSYSDSEADAVLYGPQPDVDNLIVIDRSGSMQGSKIEAAKDAARLYVDSYSTGDRIGVTSYNDAPKNEFSLTGWTNTSRGQAQSAIANMDDPDGATAIGAALQDGVDRLAALGSPNPAWAMVLLSDGQDTVADTDKHIPAFLTAYNARKDKGDQVPVIHVVAVGDDADGIQLEKVTNASNGLFQWLPETGAAQAAGSDAAAATATTLFKLDLAEVYRVFAESVADEQQIHAAQGFLNNAATKIHTVKVDGGASQAVFSVAYFYTGIGIPFTVKIRRPDNSLLGPPTLTDSRHYLWRTAAPMAGDWKVEVSPIIPGVAAAGTDADRTDFLVEAALVSDLTLDAFLGLPLAERIAGKPMPLLATLSDVKGITGATVAATIARTGEVVTLHDDGQHGDGPANDGFYGGLIKQTHQPGGYTAIIDADGVSPLNGAFVRRARLSFFLSPAKDTDNDKMPDWWEGPCMDPNTPDRDEDPDKDGLNNAAEFGHQTNPCDPDTDDGGEADGSEVDRAQDPLVPSDDFGSPPNLNAWSGAGQVVVRLTTDDASPNVTVYRGPTPEGPWGIVNAKVEGNSWTDTRVTNDTQYCYRATAAGRATSAPTAVVCVTPKLDPHPPHGVVGLPPGATQPVSLTTTIQLDGEDNPYTEEHAAYDGDLLTGAAQESGVVEMQISNRSDFTDARWESYQREKQWTFAPDANGRAVVYARFKDKAGNVSDIAALSVRVSAEPPPANQIFVPVVQR